MDENLKLLEECQHTLETEQGLYATDDEKLAKKYNMFRIDNCDLIKRIDKKIKEIKKNKKKN